MPQRRMAPNFAAWLEENSLPQPMKKRRMAPNFVAWLEENGTRQDSGEYRTTLEVEFRLARRLYDEAEGILVMEEQEKEEAAQGTRQSLQRLSFERFLSTLKGISVDWVLDVFAKTKFVRRLMEFDCPLWFVRKFCIIEFLRRRDLSFFGPFIDIVEEEFVEDRPTVYLSYSGRDKLCNFIEVLSQLRGKYIWIDIFCADQFAWTGLYIVRERRKIYRECLMDELKDKIRRINNTVLILESWNDTHSTVDQI